MVIITLFIIFWPSVQVYPHILHNFSVCPLGVSGIYAKDTIYCCSFIGWFLLNSFISEQCKLRNVLFSLFIHLVEVMSVACSLKSLQISKIVIYLFFNNSHVRIQKKVFLLTLIPLSPIIWLLNQCILDFCSKFR